MLTKKSFIRNVILALIVVLLTIGLRSCVVSQKQVSSEQGHPTVTAAVAPTRMAFK